MTVLAAPSFLDTFRRFADKPLFVFEPAPQQEQAVDGATVARNVERLGSRLQQAVAEQGKVVLVFPQGLEYVYSVLACLYANVVAVPTPIPRDIARVAASLRHIIDDAQPACILAESTLCAALRAEGGLGGLPLLDAGQLLEVAGAVLPPRAHANDDIGILLYTSGSITQPKGIRLSHGNLDARAATSAAQWRLDSNSRVVSWMPQFHSFGLELNLLIPLSQGATSIVMPPSTFAASPAEWWRAVYRHQATHTGAPNFAFDASDALAPDALAGVSLASLQAVMCGGEPVSKDSADRLMARLGPAGLDRNVLCAHYGLSEAGSVVTHERGQPPLYASLDGPALQQRRVVRAGGGDGAPRVVASCGALWPGIDVRIVDPVTLRPCAPDQVGEIWIRSASVGRGYLNREQDNRTTFDGAIADGGEQGFLRSGDLGFIDEGQLYIVGREKEVIIIHGKNHFPGDIEWTIKKRLPQLPLTVAVFSRPAGDAEQVVVVQEIAGEPGAAECRRLVRRILAAVSEAHGVEVREVALVQSGMIAKTGSGKLQRSVCKRAYLNDEIATVYRHGGPASAPASAVPRPAPAPGCIEAILKQEIFAPALGLPLSELDDIEALGELGLDSIRYVQLAERISTVFGVKFEPTLFFKYRNFDEVVACLVSLLATTADPAQAPEMAPAMAHAQPARLPAATAPATPASEDDIAIIGISCRFPGGAVDLDTFWDNLLQGRDCVTPIPPDREAFFSGRDAAQPHPKWGGFIDQVAAFDAAFFGISPLEAQSMDPQQRLMMELTWHVFEHAGYDPQQFAGQDVAVYIGAHNNDYMDLARSHAGAGETYGAFLESGLHMSMIANRVSRWFDFHGPSEVLNTACSSSLVALHHAVQALRRGDSKVAVAGGVNLILSPRVHVGSHKAGMLSEDGRCKTFDQDANGFVRAEGAGLLLLKPCRQALADGDTVYGVIKAACVNHDGKSNSLRAPNMNAQRSLIAQTYAQAYARAGVPLRSIGYIEAHGTGTPLGDPIEVQALKEAFASIDAALPPATCGLGTLKTHIGHAESAAGVGGVIKVLLQMRHATLPGLLHHRGLNPYISLQDSPFHVVDSTRPWLPPAAQDGGTEPLRAGVSSFGFGGVNAHVVLEAPAPRQAATSGLPAAHPALVVLSARTPAALAVQAAQLADALRRDALGDATLADLAYTLQIGRAAMDERLALLADSKAALAEKLEAFVAGRETAGLHRGQVRRDRDALRMFSLDDDFATVVDTWFDKRKYDQLLALWCKGLALDWCRLYGPAAPRRVALPVYPFARDVHWLPPMEAAPAYGVARPVLHPLLQRNTSNLAGPRFSSSFDGSEFFLQDHVIQGARLLPGAAYLEIARAAWLQVAEAPSGAQAVRISNVAWPAAFKLGQERRELQLGLYPEADGALAYTAYSEAGPGEVLRHCEGRIAPLDAPQPASHAIDALRSGCPHEITAEHCYTQWHGAGLAYGPAHRTITAMHVGQEHVLARLALPPALAADMGAYVLHPALLDGALQAVMGWQVQDGHDLPGPLALPFALRQIDIHQPCRSAMWAVVTRAPQAGKLQMYDIDLCDEHGAVCARLHGFATRTVADTQAWQAGAAPEPAAGTLVLHPVLRPQALSPQDRSAPTPAARLAILCGIDGVDPEQVAAQVPGLRCVAWEWPEDGAAAAFGVLAERALAQVRQLLLDRAALPCRIQLVVPVLGRSRVLAALAGLVYTAQLENPALQGQLIRINADMDAAALGRLLRTEQAGAVRDVVYEEGERYAAGWDEIAPEQAPVLPWKAQGVYLITGGAGGLGRLFAMEIARHAPAATLVLSGRSAPDAAQPTLQALAALGANARYVQADVSDPAASAALMANIRAEHGRLDGIIHSAGVTRDSFLIHKTPQQLHEVLAAKVAGLVNLDEASRDFMLDCFICFSSMAAHGHVGQGDYAMANAFMDAYSAYRNGLVACGQRHGQTLSVNWPLWQEGSMGMDAQAVQRMLDEQGLAPLATADGFAALYRGLACGHDQLFVVAGKVAQLRAQWLAPPSAPVQPPRPPQPATVETPAAAPRRQAADYLAGLLSSVLRLPVQQIDADAPMEQYGIDSILVMQLNAELEKVFGSLPKTLFFEYQTLGLLAAYFAEHHGARLTQVLGSGTASAAAPSIVPATPATPAAPVPAASRPLARYGSAPLPMRSAPVRRGPGTGVMDVAVIGVSGRYAQAGNLQAFWDNLREGRDCITEIPAGRWDHSRYFDAARAPGKAYSKWGGFIDGIDCFDPLFFNISPREAQAMDPQERLFLEQAYATIEDAGYTPAALSASRKVGVFVGVMNGRYAGGARFWSIANRVSYLLNLQGPSLAIDTACSSSLVAIHQALESLYSGSSECALAGGVNLIVHPDHYLSLSAMNMLSAGAQCRPFGQHADGFVDGEGVGAVLLKPLDKAIADGDNIYGVIKGSMVNAGGKTNGFTVPNPAAQAQLVSDALQRAGIHARAVSYLEAHGTGTALGDPIEIAGLDKAFRAHTEDRQFCAIGSVKSGIGHCESAAGIAGVTKVLLQMRHGLLVPSLHARELNPYINFADTAFTVQQDAVEWRRPVLDVDGVRREYPRIAGVSSFGAGGVNAHVLIEEYRAPAAPRLEVSAQRPALVVLSACTAEGLHGRAAALLAALRGGQAPADLAAIAYTLQVGREAMAERLAMLVTSPDELERQLAGFCAGQPVSGHCWHGTVARNSSALRLLAHDDDAAHMAATWIAKGKYAQLLEGWTQGLPVDWRQLYGAAVPRRVSLPSYPFARERYWTAPATQPVEPVPAALPAPKPADPAEAAGGGDTLELQLARHVGQLTGIALERIDGDADFYEYGFDSIRLQQLVGELNRAMGLRLNALALFEHATINRLAAHLRSAYPAACTQAGLRRWLVSGEEPVPVLLYYPTSAPARRMEMGAFTPVVALDGAVPATVRGVILISHCAGGSELGHHNLAQRLACHGYLVAALQHPGDNWHDDTRMAAANQTALRAGQVSRVLDALLADQEWGPRIPPGRVGALGHSAGAATVLALTGGELSPEQLAQHCTSASDDAVFCGAFGAAGGSDADQGRVVHDSRIGAAVLLAPPGVVFVPASLRRIAVPLRVYAAEHDTVLSHAHHAGWLHTHLPQAAFETVAGAGHFSFMAEAIREVQTRLGGWADPDGFDRAAFLRRLEQEVVAFFDAQLVAPAATSDAVLPTPSSADAVLFAGQGSQFKGMGGDLFARYPDWTASASAILGYSIEELCLDDPQQRLGRTEYTQPALYVVNALGYRRLLEEKGAVYRPCFVAGHSLGEYNALQAAGVVDFETGLRLVQRRGQLMAAASGGGMRAVLGAHEARIRAWLRLPELAGIDIANLNTPTQFVLAGQDEALRALEARCQAEEVRCIPLNVSAAFHSRHMREARDAFAHFLDGVELRAPRMDVVANLSGQPYADGQAAATLADQIAQPVRWVDSINYMLANGASNFIEVGGSLLSRMVSEIRGARQTAVPEPVQQPIIQGA